MNTSIRLKSLLAAALAAMVALFATPAVAQFAPYSPAGTFELPGFGPFDVLPNGRIISLVGTTVYRETASGSRVFVPIGNLPGADIGPFGAAFISASPLGNKIAVGNNGGASFLNYEVGVFDLSSFTGTWFDAPHFDGEWITNRLVALTAGDFVNPSTVTALDTQSANPATPSNPVIIGNIGGASAGITLDLLGNLYTGNGFATSGPSGTGAVKAFPAGSWVNALNGGSPLNFETQGALIIDVLSASPLGFDHKGNLLVGGGDFGTGDSDYAAVARGADVLKALIGGGPVNPGNPNKVQKLDPNPASSSSFYSIEPNRARGEVYVTDVGFTTVHVYR